MRVIAVLFLAGCLWAQSQPPDVNGNPSNQQTNNFQGWNYLPASQVQLLARGYLEILSLHAGADPHPETAEKRLKHRAL